MQAIILAGGFGTRLIGVVSDLPKPMAPIRGVPFLSYILDQLNDYGFSKVVLAVGYLSNKIKDFYGPHYKNLKIQYSYEDTPLGTGGCVYQAVDLIEDDYVYVINGDTYFDIDFNSIHKPKRALIVCKHIKNASRYGRVIFNDSNIITSFAEKQSDISGYINGGIYYLKKDIFNEFNVSNKFSLEKDFFEKYIHKLNIEVFKSEAYFIDIGIPEDYERAQNEL